MMKICLVMAALGVVLALFGCNPDNSNSPTATAIETTTVTQPPATQTVTVTSDPVTITTTRTATVTATTPPDIPGAGYEIIEPIRYEVVEKSGALWRLAWRVSIRNLTDTELPVNVRVDFLGSSGFILEWAYIPVTLKPGEDRTVAGEIVSISEKASQITEIVLRTNTP